MKYKVVFLISFFINIALYLTFAELEIRSKTIKRASEISELRPTIEVLVSKKGTVKFEAYIDGCPASGIEISIDKKKKGLTDEKGSLKIEWLIAGEHSWYANYKGQQISQGEFKIPQVIGAKIIDRGVAIGGVASREGFKIRPFKDKWVVFLSVMNTGTTMIDHFSFELLSNLIKSSAMNIKLVSPRIPSWIWKPFVRGKLSRGIRKIEVAIKDDRVEMTDFYTRHPIENVKLRTPISKGSIGPGEVITIEFEEYYKHNLEEFMHGSASELDTVIILDVLDKENNLMNVTIGKYKFGFFTFHNIKARAHLKGKNKKETCLLNLYIDNKMYDSLYFVAYEWI